MFLQNWALTSWIIDFHLIVRKDILPFSFKSLYLINILDIWHKTLLNLLKHYDSLPSPDAWSMNLSGIHTYHTPQKNLNKIISLKYIFLRFIYINMLKCLFCFFLFFIFGLESREVIPLPVRLGKGTTSGNLEMREWIVIHRSKPRDHENLKEVPYELWLIGFLCF